MRAQLARVLASPQFANAPRMRHFLQLVVDNTLSGEAPLKETVIGIDVFGRAAGYDPGAEPIVRVEARRLRQKLAEYYDRAGTRDAIVIVLPKGGYTPRFEFRTAARVASIAVLPMRNLSGDPAQDHLADAMTEGLTATLARVPSLHVASGTSAMRYKEARMLVSDIARELRVDAVVEGSVGRAGNTMRITTRLIDAAADRHLWSRTYRRSNARGFAAHDEVARSVTRHVRLTLARRRD